MTFVDELVTAGVVSPEGLETLQIAGATTPEEVYELVSHFPGLTDLDTRRLLVMAREQLDESVVTAIDSASEQAPIAASTLGALPPDGSLDADNYQLGSPAFVGPILADPDLNVLPSAPWPVRDQWLRGTCVAHSIVALVEHFNAGNTMPDYSEQFLFAQAKQLDNMPNIDGTQLEFGANALRAHGVCDELSLRYNPTPVAADIGHVSSLPTSAAAMARHPPPAYQRMRRPTPRGAAKALYSQLNRRRLPVAISVPVFFDTLRHNVSNWMTPRALNYGEVTNPLRGMLARGGHAVCVTGYVNDASAAGGGWFIFRNSWGPEWARLAPPGVRGRPSPAVGYGAISAYYVDRFLWEYCHL
jgi:hypothetical protein